MRIGIDARMWNETGIGRYIRNITSNISKLDTTDEFVVFLLQEHIDLVDLPKNFKKVVANIKWNSFDEQLVLPNIFYSEKLDVLFSPNFNISIFYNRPFVLTVHDLTVIKFKTGRATTLPFFVYQIKRLGAHIAFHLGLRRASKIVTVSEFVKKDILSTFNISPEKIEVVSCGVEPNFQPVAFGDQIRVLQKYGISKPYLFYVGNAHPHKNLERLIEAFELLSEEFPDLTLVLGGSKKFFYERLENEWKHKPIYQKLRFVGFVEESDLPALYSGSEAFVNPSLYEGFGLQLLEAFSCNTKVICSGVSSLPEVGGEAAYYFNPEDIADIKNTISLALKDTTSNKRELGLVQVGKYTWQLGAKKILNLLLSIKK